MVMFLAVLPSLQYQITLCRILLSAPSLQSLLIGARFGDCTARKFPLGSMHKDFLMQSFKNFGPLYLCKNGAIMKVLSVKIHSDCSRIISARFCSHFRSRLCFILQTIKLPGYPFDDLLPTVLFSVRP